MGWKRRSYETKLNVIQAYESGNASFRGLAEQIGTKMEVIRQWWMIYQSQGAEGLRKTYTYKHWNKEIKFAAVEEYLSGACSQMDICKKYKISSKSILQKWIKVYNDGQKEFKSTSSGGKKPMTKGRKTTFDERLEITQYCIANGRNYGAAMDKYNVSYQQIYFWVKKYNEKGIDGLLDRRGKAKSECELTETDKLRTENKMLEAKNIELEMENR